MCYCCTVVVQALSAVSTLLCCLLFIGVSFVIVSVVIPLRGNNPTLVTEPGFAGHRPPVCPRWLSLVFRSSIDTLLEPTFDTTYQYDNDDHTTSRPQDFELSYFFIHALLLLQFLLSHLSFALCSLSLFLLCRFHVFDPRTFTTTFLTSPS